MASKNVNGQSAVKNIRFPHQLLEDIAEAQGDLSFAAWVIDACARKLAGGATPEISLNAAVKRLESIAQQFETIQERALPAIEVKPVKSISSKPVKKPAERKTHTVHTPGDNGADPRIAPGTFNAAVLELARTITSNHEIADRLNADGVSPGRGGELTHRVVMNTKTRLKKWGYLD
ncbi:TPA: hypothetical protein SLG82_005236 [Citrobacter freundii]|nr:hypothetical protein [Citrobacter freundii]HEI8803139.1 hypothetical protein [Citrobacter freundii]